MDFVFTIHVSVEREEGKFASRDEIAGLIIEGIEDPGSLDTDDGATYSVTMFEVQEEDKDFDKIVAAGRKLKDPELGGINLIRDTRKARKMNQDQAAAILRMKVSEFVRLEREGGDAATVARVAEELRLAL